MSIAIGNYGNETIALLQWALENSLSLSYVVSIDTGFAAESWRERQLQGEAFAMRSGFKPILLKPLASFSELIFDRKQFPDKKHQWCTAMLKGIPLNHWLDSIDPNCEAVVVLGKWRKSSRALSELPEMIEESEHYQGRKVWHPLFLHEKSELDALVERAGFSVLPHRSLECDPCIHNTMSDFQRISLQDINKTRNLEEVAQQIMFEEYGQGIDSAVQSAKQHGKVTEKNYNGTFYNGCGSPWGCGL
ncbi:MAG: hypothetical protein JSS53_01430 [Proteobacteria bacterium]|nr:hypothetical protein [Pseudomonadota bacterium]